MIRTLLMLLAGFCFAGPIPRRLGVISTEPAYETFVWWLDTLALLGFAAVVAVIVWQWLLYDKTKIRR